MTLWETLTSDRFISIERKLLTVFLMLSVYFLGTWSMTYTQNQIKEYAENICGLYLNGSLECKIKAPSFQQFINNDSWTIYNVTETT